MDSNASSKLKAYHKAQAERAKNQLGELWKNRVAEKGPKQAVEDTPGELLEKVEKQLSTGASHSRGPSIDSTNMSSTQWSDVSLGQSSDQMTDQVSVWTSEDITGQVPAPRMDGVGDQMASQSPFQGSDEVMSQAFIQTSDGMADEVPGQSSNQATDKVTDPIPGEFPFEVDLMPSQISMQTSDEAADLSRNSLSVHVVDQASNLTPSDLTPLLERSTSRLEAEYLLRKRNQATSQSSSQMPGRFEDLSSDESSDPKPKQTSKQLKGKSKQHLDQPSDSALDEGAFLSSSDVSPRNKPGQFLAKPFEEPSRAKSDPTSNQSKGKLEMAPDLSDSSSDECAVLSSSDELPGQSSMSSNMHWLITGASRGMFNIISLSSLRFSNAALFSNTRAHD
jgi:hypothetical protein